MSTSYPSPYFYFKYSLLPILLNSPLTKIAILFDKVSASLISWVVIIKVDLNFPLFNF